MNIKQMIIGIALFAGLALASCHKETEDVRYIDFATISNITTDGTTLTLRADADSPEVTYTTNMIFPSAEFPVGTRIVMDYYPDYGLRYVSGPIYIYQALKAIGNGEPPVAQTAAGTDNWKSDPVEIESCDRQGKYIDIAVWGTTSLSSNQISVVLDSDTQNSAIPELHLIFDAAPGFDAASYRFFLSYDIGELWNKDTTQSVKLIYTDNDGAQNFVELKKQN